MVVRNALNSLLQCTNVLGTCSRSVSTKQRQKLVILGTGWGSFNVLKRVNHKLYDVIVVSPRNHFLFTPLLAGTTVGTLEFRSIIEPIRNVGFKQDDHFHLSKAIDVDFKNQVLHVESMLKPNAEYSLPYDKLVIGVGALSNTFGTPGVAEHAYFLKEIEDARKIRHKILSNFEHATQPSVNQEERKRLLSIVIVGGGPTGVEFGAEIYDFIQQDIARLFRARKDDVKVTLVESNHILAAFDQKLRNYAEQKIKGRRGFTLKQSRVTAVHEDHVELQDGEKIPCGLVVWSTGLAPRQFVKDLNIGKNNNGQIQTDEYLRILDDPSGNSYAIGDCASIHNYPLPCTAQVAERQGKYLAKQLNQEPVDKFKFRTAGMLAYIGSYKGLSDLPKGKLQGLPSWLLWRSAYLSRLCSWRLRMQVPVDWLKTLMFGRDVSTFSF